MRTLTFSVEELHDVTLPPNHLLLVWVTHRSQRYGRTKLRRGKKKKMKNEYRTFEAMFVGMVETWCL